ncbi:hypothetical protein MSAN_00491100 [Mycena sanguinolenta]|uniref:Uncharacterized protein n=1 Tax=Mycena sanguinolenta TaxID=230812 RepID=A0A8H7DIS1_9AGAR|nr:hypothetical protein MSAN_00491100 [Mycena sanguinolenta]
MILKGPPFYHHRRAPGLWPWDDFHMGARLLPQDPLLLPPGAELKTNDPELVRAFYGTLFSGWENPALRALPRAGSRVFQLDVSQDKQFQLHTEATLKKEDEAHFGKYLFIDRLSKSVLEILGVQYHVDVEYFRACCDLSVSQSMGENYIQITLPFLRSRVIETRSFSSAWKPSEDLTLDFLGLYLIFGSEESTVVVYHPPVDDKPETGLLEHCQWTIRMGQEPHWRNILRNTHDEMFLVFPALWWVTYAWADALEALYLYLDHMETKVLESPSVQLTQEFHRIRICLLNYKALLEDFLKTISFVTGLKRPRRVHMEPEVHSQLESECSRLGREISRIRDGVEGRNERIKDIMNLVFSHVTIQDSTAMKQISWITMFFLPATFVAGVFGMNVSGLGADVTTLLNYVEIAIPLTVVTIWILVALLPESQARKPLWERFAWPFLLCAQSMWNLMGDIGARIHIPKPKFRKESSESLPLPVMSRRG